MVAVFGYWLRVQLEMLVQRLNTIVGNSLDFLRRKRRTLALVAALAGLFDVLLILYFAFNDRVPNAFGAAMSEALNDPGKTIFHIVLLPLAIFTFLRDFRGKDLYDRSHAVSGYILCGFLGIAILVGIRAHERYVSLDAPQDPARHLRSPADYANPICGQSLFEIRRQARALQRERDKAAQDEVRANSATKPSTGDVQQKTRSSTVVSQETESTTKRPEGSTQSQQLTRIDAAMLNLRASYLATISDKTCADISIRSHWSVALTILGLSFIVILIWEVLMDVFLLYQESYRVQLIITTAAVLTVWIPLRTYSDSYLNFGVPSRYFAEALIAVGAAIVVIGPTWLLQLKSVLATKVIVSIIAAASAAITVIAAMNVEKLNNFVVELSALDWEDLFIIYALFGVAIAAAVYVLATRPAPADTEKHE